MAKTFQRLTRTAMRQLRPRDSLAEHGITFDRLPDGDGRFSIGIMVDGVRIHRVVGKESDGTTRTQAEEYIEKLRSDAKHDRLALPRARKVALSFEAAAAKYIAKLRESGGKNISTKERQLLLHLVPFFNMPVAKISGFDVERYCKHRSSEVAQVGGDRSGQRRLQGRLTAPGTINRELAVLSHLLTCAVDWDWIPKKPRIRRLKEGAGRIVYLTAEQSQRLLAAAKQSDNPHLYAFVLVALETSLRKSEVLAIRRDHIDLPRRTIYIERSKTGARAQPITSGLAAFLKDYLRESVSSASPWLFPAPASASGHVVSIEKPFRKAVVTAGLDPKQVVRHTLRHTAVSHLVQAGVDLPTVMRVSGHKTLQMVQRYAHQDSDHVQSAMDKLEKRIRA